MIGDSADHQRQMGNFDREIANIARLGVISEIEGNTARVQIGQLETDLIHWLSPHAAADYEWWAPSIGEQVLVISLWGDPSQGIIVGAVPQDAFPAPAAGVEWAKRFSDGTVLRYDPQAHALRVEGETAGITVICQNATVKAESVTIDAPSLHCTGAVKVDGDITAAGDVKAGGISLKSHTHGGVEAGGSTTGAPQ